MKKKLVFLFFSVHTQIVFSQTIAGYIRDSVSKEPLIGVTIQLNNDNLLTQSNHYGFFRIAFQKETSFLKISMVGYSTKMVFLPIQKDSILNILLKEDSKTLDVVEIKAFQENESQKNQMSSIILSNAQIKQMPLIFGEKDPLKALQLMPGVAGGTEGTSGFYVRGGGSDQNLLLLDEAIVYNANHLFGFFSTFNADPIKQVELYKGAFPARYGGRLSSVVDVQMREGSKQRFHGEGGIGLISSRLTLEGPIKKNKYNSTRSSFLISGRRTYADLLTRPFFSKSSTISYYFYDINAKFNSEINQNNHLFLSFYQGNDNLETKEIRTRQTNQQVNITNLGWGNYTSVLRWNHVFSKNIFSNFSAIYTKYHFKLNDSFEKVLNAQSSTEKLEFTSNVADFSLKTDFDYYHSKKFSAKWGGLFTLHQFDPRKISLSFSPNSEQNIVNSAAKISNIESGVYFETAILLKKYLTLNIGGRESFFISSKNLKLNFEPRISVHQIFSKKQSIQASYARMNQYTHLISNTGGGLPTDLWIPSTQTIQPAQSDQIAISYTKDNLLNGVSLTFESYYKWLKNVITYKDGASFLDINSIKSSKNLEWENDLTAGEGWSYGYELFLQKKTGKLTGSLGYTLAWSIQQFNDLNAGKSFYSSQDRRHNFEIIGSYSINKHLRISVNGVFMSGNALSIPNGVYFLQDQGTDNILYFNTRNGFRAEPYHRVDVGLQFYKKKKWGERTWDLSIYNMYNRKNPFYYSTIKKLGSDNTYSVGLTRNWLLPILPSISYNFKF